MNKKRTKIISECVCKLQDVLDDENEARENMPENLQESEAYERSENASENLEEAISLLEEIIS